ncbi:MAG: hypothetical protein COB54_01660 [Alphaproteobacteria bacterium]|nr:MAG: hypothetical protein COB54_01660 [Alphaproteobacteria bacterium]
MKKLVLALSLTLILAGIASAESTALRQLVEANLGNIFDLRAFHDTVLGNGYRLDRHPRIKTPPRNI